MALVTAAQQLLFEEKDELFWVGIGKSSSGDYVILER